MTLDSPADVSVVCLEVRHASAGPTGQAKEVVLRRSGGGMAGFALLVPQSAPGTQLLWSIPKVGLLSAMTSRAQSGPTTMLSIEATSSYSPLHDAQVGRWTPYTYTAPPH